MVWLALRCLSTSLNSHSRNIQKAQIRPWCDSSQQLSRVKRVKQDDQRSRGLQILLQSGTLAQWSAAAAAAVTCRDSLAQTPRHIPVQQRAQTQQINSCTEGSERREGEFQQYGKQEERWRKKLTWGDLWCSLKRYCFSLIWWLIF